MLFVSLLAQLTHGLCHNELLKFYGLEGTEEPSDYSQLTAELALDLCPGTQASCCSADDFTKTKDLWNRKSDAIRTYLSKIFKIFQKLSTTKTLMTSLFNRLSPDHQRDEYCRDVDTKIADSQATFDQMYVYLSNALSTFAFLQKGFYCMICDEKNHQHIKFSHSSKFLEVNHSFCTNLMYFFKEYIAFRMFYIDPLVVNLSFLFNCLNKDTTSLYKIKYSLPLSQIKGCVVEKKQCHSLCEEFRVGSSLTMFIGELEQYSKIITELEATLNRFDQQESVADFVIEEPDTPGQFFNVDEPGAGQEWNLSEFEVKITDDGLDLFEISENSKYNIVGGVETPKATELPVEAPVEPAENALTAQKIEEMKADDKAPSVTELATMNASQEQLDKQAMADIQNGSIGNMDQPESEMVKDIAKVPTDDSYIIATLFMVICLINFS